MDTAVVGQVGGAPQSVFSKAAHALAEGHVEHALHAVNNPLSTVAALTRATAPVQIVPTAVYFGGRELLRGHPRGDQIATNVGLAASGVVDGVFTHEGLLGAHLQRGLPAVLTQATHGSRLLSGLGRAAGVLGKVIPGVIAVGGGISVANVVREHGGDARAVVQTQEGREGALRAVGGAMLLAPMPVVKLLGAGAFLLAATNDGGLLAGFDGPLSHVQAVWPAGAAPPVERSITQVPPGVHG